MEFYITIKTIHIIFAGIWLVNFIMDSYFQNLIAANKGKKGEKKLIILYISIINMIGIVGATGILITGIFMVMANPAYSFFQLTANHWLTTKQIVMVVILLMIFLKIIPQAKKLRTAIGDDLESSETISEGGYKNLNSIYKINLMINILIIINFILAITHYYLS
ncbi:hypothetical protein ABRY23_09680 [Melioribacteraceae bacterium 4301-Me]|uniref:hypothetical protein n=1 Tax=Pyranulibacter aquaticus TaxID=3163344 RepID=UPI00359B98E6